MIRYALPLLGTLLLLALSRSVIAESPNHTDIGVEVQIYPTGIISGVRIERGFNQKHSMHLRLARQDIDHEDYGEQDDEQGNGYGFSLGYRYFLNPHHQGLSFGIKNDVWFNTIDWKNDIGTNQESSGRTKVVVLQPTATVSYQHLLQQKWFISPSFAAGFEINVDTDGEEVGEGVIWLFGLTVGRRL